MRREENGPVSLQSGKQQVCGSNGAGSDTLHFIIYILFDCLVSSSFFNSVEREREKERERERDL